MRWILYVLAVAASVDCKAQWENVLLSSIPLGEGYAGPGALRSGRMAATGIGFWSTSLVLSPSSGTVSKIFFTESEWQQAEQVFMITNESLALVGTATEHALFFTGYYGGYRLMSLLSTPSGYEMFDYGLYGSSLVVAPITDTTCIVVKDAYIDSTLILRSSPHTSEVLDTLASSYGWAREMDFFNNESGVMRCRTSDGHERVLTTVNGGTDWDVALHDSVHVFNAMDRVDSVSLWLVGDDGSILRTPDLGASWETIPSPTTSDLLTVAACSADSAWVGGRSGAIFSTSNGGLTWHDRSLADSLVIRLEAVEGAVYAHTSYWFAPWGIYDQRRLYKFSGGMSGLDEPVRTGEQQWWAYSGIGIDLRLNEGEHVQLLEMIDAYGREVNALLSGQAIYMDQLRPGMYIVKLQTDQRTSVAKVIWPGLH